MVGLDGWREIYDTVRRNRLRTILTALSVAWGIFMLVLLLGAGRGLQNSVEHNFRDDATNSIWMRARKTSKPYKGHKPGRRLQFRNGEFDAVKKVDGVEYITGRFNMWNNSAVSYKDKNSQFDIRSTHPDHKHLEKTIITQGRYISDLDLKEHRKVVVIGKAVVDFLFEDEDPIGKWIKVAGVAFKVIGTFVDVGGEGELRKVYLPVTTAQRAFNGQDRLHQIMFTVGEASLEESRKIEDETRALLAERMHFDPSDKRAVRMRNNIVEYQEIKDIFSWIRMFIWIVGIGTIVAGVVGVSNIMLISVTERTKEFGIRKALGAKPGSIIRMVVAEAIALTAVAGYCGVVAGVFLLEFGGNAMPDNDFIKDPQIDISVVLAATGLLIVAGTLAGYFPARRAAKVNPIVALRDE